MITNRVYLKKISLFFVSIVLLGVLATVVMAAVSQAPLFLSTGIKPNVIILLDNSSSMWNVCWHKNYPADASLSKNPNWFNGFFDGANDNMVLKKDNTIGRFVLYFKSNMWNKGTGSKRANQFSDLPSGTSLPENGKSYILNANCNTDQYDKVLIADPNDVFWVTPVTFSTADTSVPTSYTSLTPIYWDSAGKNYIVVNSSGTGVKGVKLPQSVDSQAGNNTWFTGSYLNWLYLAASDSDRADVSADSSYTQYHTTRIHAAKEAIKQAINNTLNSEDGSSKYRWACYTYTCLTDSAPPRLGPTTWTNPDSSSNITSLLSAIDGVWPGSTIPGGTGTPLGNTINMIWEKVLQLSTGGPITSRCQQNYLIVVTDGYPNFKPDSKTDAANSDAGTIASRNSDGTLSQKVTDFWYNPAFPEGTEYSNQYRSKAHIVTQRMRQGFSMTFSSPSVTENMTVETFVIGLSFLGDSTTNIITDSSSLLYMMAANGGGNAFGVADSVSLNSALASTLNTIASRIASASSVAVNTAFLTSNTKLYRTRFNSADWSGFLDAYSLNQTDGTVSGYPNSPLWEAGAKLENNSSRNIYTACTLSGTYHRIDFQTGNSTTLQNAGLALASDNNAANLISYIRGDSTPTGYRQRARKLGDMTYSAPVISGPPDGYYTDNNYQSFKSAQAGRGSLVIVGANDGMLHAFDADTGEERWAFIPNSLLPNLKMLSVTPYNHQNYVGGSPTIGDAFITSKNSDGTAKSAPEWRTVLVCGLREGGSSYFALDVTDRANPIPLWEITPSSTSDDGNPNGLGYTFGAPLILKLKDSSQTATGGFRWVAVLPNGYQGATSGKSASLLIVDLGSGQIIKEIVVDTVTNGTNGHQNGLSSPSALDTDSDFCANYIYAGDLNGHLWKFDVSGDGKSNWNVSYKKGSNPVPLFHATDTVGGNPQPITTAPDIVLRGGFQIVFFGTGKYFEDSDKTTTQTQSFYGLYDYNLADNNPTVTGKYSKSNLVQRTLTDVTAGGNTYRYFTSESTFVPDPTHGSNMGWFVNLPSSGERVIADPVAHARRIIFTTFTPNTDSCSFGGTSWLMELNQDTGGTITSPAFDVNGNGVVDGNDKIDNKIPVGMYTGDGSASSPTIVGGGSDRPTEYKYFTKTTGDLARILEGGGRSQIGMRSWRQLR